jgi:hypothetical protein
VDLLLYIDSEDYYLKFISILEELSKTSTEKNILISAESIVGRTPLDVRQGLIHRLIDQQKFKTAIAITEIVELMINRYKGTDFNRLEKINGKIFALKSELEV